LRAPSKADEQKKERAPRTNRSDSFDLEEVTKRLLGVDIANTPFKRDDTEGINRRLFPSAERGLSEKAGVGQQRLKRHSTASFARSLTECWESRGSQAANKPPLAQKLFEGWRFFLT